MLSSCKVVDLHLCRLRGTSGTICNLALNFLQLHNLLETDCGRMHVPFLIEISLPQVCCVRVLPQIINHLHLFNYRHVQIE